MHERGDVGQIMELGFPTRALSFSPILMDSKQTTRPKQEMRRHTAVAGYPIKAGQRGKMMAWSGEETGKTTCF